jgi:hypothetical protein
MLAAVAEGALVRTDRNSLSAHPRRVKLDCQKHQSRGIKSRGTMVVRAVLEPAREALSFRAAEVWAEQRESSSARDRMRSIIDGFRVGVGRFSQARRCRGLQAARVEMASARPDLVDYWQTVMCRLMARVVKTARLVLVEAEELAAQRLHQRSCAQVKRHISMPTVHPVQVVEQVVVRDSQARQEKAAARASAFSSRTAKDSSSPEVTFTLAPAVLVVAVAWDRVQLRAVRRGQPALTLWLHSPAARVVALESAEVVRADQVSRSHGKVRHRNFRTSRLPPQAKVGLEYRPKQSRMPLAT